MAPTTVDRPWPFRLAAWLEERFPPVTYSVLVALFAGAGFALVRAVIGLPAGAGWRLAAAGIGVWLFFLHLRVFDEHKDFDADRVAYPDRVLSRGVVTLGLLRVVGAVAIAGEAVVAGLLGPAALTAWAAALAFSVLMRLEFGVGRWLREHIVVYALTHNPVVGLLAWFVLAATHARPVGEGWWFVGVASLGSLAFEVGRKTRLPAEEHPGVPSYTTELGQPGARALLAGIYVLLVAFVSGSLYAVRLPDPWPVVVAWAVVAPGLLTVTGRAKRVELGASLALLGSFAAMGVVGWAMP